VWTWLFASDRYTAVHASPKSGGTVYSISSWMCMGIVNSHILEMESAHCPKRSQKELRVELAREMMALHSSRRREHTILLTTYHHPSTSVGSTSLTFSLPFCTAITAWSNRVSRKCTNKLLQRGRADSSLCSALFLTVPHLFSHVKHPHILDYCCVLPYTLLSMQIFVFLITSLYCTA
jgi:hypothetical protein